MKNRNLGKIFSVLCVMFFWLGWGALWLVISFEKIQSSWILAILFFLALLCFGFFIILTKSQRNIWIVSGLCVAGAVALGLGNWLFMLGIAVLCWLLFLFGVKRIKDEQRNRSSIDVYFILRRGTSIVGLALSVLIASAFYFSLAERSKASTVSVFEIKIPQGVTDRGLALSDVFFSDQNFKLIVEGVTVDEYISQSLFGRDGDAGIILPGALAESSFGRVAVLEEGRKNLSRQFGIELSGQEKMNEVINLMLERRTNEIFSGQVSHDPMFPFGAAIALLIAAYSLAWLLGLLTLWTSVILFYILSRLHIVVIDKEMKEVETID